jgi:hypothetical protein
MVEEVQAAMELVQQISDLLVDATASITKTTKQTRTQRKTTTDRVFFSSLRRDLVV